VQRGVLAGTAEALAPALPTLYARCWRRPADRDPDLPRWFSQLLRVAPLACSTGWAWRRRWS
jgi:hypothetical protein